MKRSIRHAFTTFFALCLLQLYGQGCSSDQQQLEDPLLTEEGGEDSGEEAVSENDGEENFANENFGNENLSGENFANDQGLQGDEGGLNNETGQNFANDQFNSLGGDNPLVANEAQSNNDLENIIEEINNASQGNEGQVDLVQNQVANNQEIGAAPLPENTTLVGTPLAPGLPELGSKMSYVVQRGDTLVAIAQRIYGDGNQWTEIANFTGLANPRLIYPGDVVYYQLTQQTVAFASAYESVQRSEIQVQSGDTLSTIAGRVLGDPSKWKMIWRQNDNIDNPDQLTAGTTIFYVDPGTLSSALDLFKRHFTNEEQTKFSEHSKPEKTLELTDFDTDLNGLSLNQVSLDSHALSANLSQNDFHMASNGKNVKKQMI